MLANCVVHRRKDLTSHTWMDLFSKHRLQDYILLDERMMQKPLGRLSNRGLRLVRGGLPLSHRMRFLSEALFRIPT